MKWFKSKPDPVSDRARALNARIAQLEQEIRKLSADPSSASPRIRSSVTPTSTTDHSRTQTTTPVSPATAPSGDSLFEDVQETALKRPETSTREHYNDLGLRKYDLPALWRRWIGLFQPPPNPQSKLVNYLAAGSIQGLRPLRYEKRVARNRFIFLVALFVLVLWGLIAFSLRHR